MSEDSGFVPSIKSKEFSSDEVITEEDMTETQPDLNDETEDEPTDVDSGFLR